MLIKLVNGGELYKLANDYCFYSYRSNISLNQNSLQKKKLPSYKTYVDKLYIALSNVRFFSNISLRYIYIYIYIYIYGDRGGTVVKVLCHKSEGRWFNPS